MQQQINAWLELYAAADRAGLLLWQDLPLQWGYARGTRKQAARQAREAVDLLEVPCLPSTFRLPTRLPLYLPASQPSRQPSSDSITLRGSCHNFANAKNLLVE